SRASLSPCAVARCLESDVVCRSGDGPDFFRAWCRDGRAGDKRCSPRRLHFWLSLFATSRWWLSRSVLEVTYLLSCLCLHRLLQPPAHALGLDELVLGCILRRLRAAVRGRHLARPAILLNAALNVRLRNLYSRRPRHRRGRRRTPRRDRGFGCGGQSRDG